VCLRESAREIESVCILTPKYIFIHLHNIHIDERESVCILTSICIHTYT
jgi:hypothetical protein